MLLELLTTGVGGGGGQAVQARVACLPFALHQGKCALKVSR